MTFRQVMKYVFAMTNETAPRTTFLSPDTLPAITSAAVGVPEPMAYEDFDELDAVLEEMRARYDETPQWEFCEGFMAALLCTRRPIEEADYLSALLALPLEGDGPDAETGSFATDAQRSRFMSLWHQRWAEVVSALDAEVDSLEDERCYHPEVMDIRGAVADMPPAEQSQFADESLPAFGQVWALGFMFAVEYYSEDWVTPKDKDAAKWLNSALEAIVAMTEDDTAPPEVSPLSEEGAPSASIARLNAFGEAIWAVYDLRELWKTIGPKIETVRAVVTPGRNDPCPCGSGKKYKKCHGL